MYGLTGKQGVFSAARILLVIGAMTPVQGFAACTVSSTAVAFGAYDVFATTANDSVGSIKISCDTSTAYSIALSPGSGGSWSGRTLENGISELVYNLFVDAARTQVWGDGTGGTATVGATATSANHTVYGRITAGQNVTTGTYTDTVIITVTY